MAQQPASHKQRGSLRAWGGYSIPGEESIGVIFTRKRKKTECSTEYQTIEENIGFVGNNLPKSQLARIGSGYPLAVEVKSVAKVKAHNTQLFVWYSAARKSTHILRWARLYTAVRALTLADSVPTLSPLGLIEEVLDGMRVNEVGKAA